MRRCETFKRARAGRGQERGVSRAFAFDLLTAHLRLGTDGRAGVDATNVALGEREASDGG